MPNLTNSRPPSPHSVVLVIRQVDHIVCGHFKTSKANIKLNCYSTIVVDTEDNVVLLAFTQHLHENTVLRLSLETNCYVLLQGPQVVLEVGQIDLDHWTVVESSPNL